jgi:hypothetical protein
MDAVYDEAHELRATAEQLRTAARLAVERSQRIVQRSVELRNGWLNRPRSRDVLATPWR